MTNHPDREFWQNQLAIRRADLEGHIVETLQLMREYEEILRLSNSPTEKARARKALKPLREQLREYQQELAGLAGQPGPGSPAQPGREASARGLHWGAPDPAEIGGPVRHRWAVVVGVNRYDDPGIAPLNFCVNDVLALQRLLGRGGYDVLALHDQVAERHRQPTRLNIKSALRSLCQAVEPDDLLWVHFAGHGQLVGGQPFLLAQDSRLNLLAESGLSLADLERQLHASPARRLVVTLDACHVGVETTRGGSDPDFNRHAHDLAAGFALIAASTAQQKAQEWQAEQHGVFTYYLLEGLAGQADRLHKQFVTVDDLKTYTLDRLRRWNALNGSLLQEPSARTEGLGDMILVDYRPDQSGNRSGQEAQS